MRGFEMYEDDTRSISITWSVGDVASIRPDLTADQCYEVLLCAERHHDCERGITWDFLDYHADNLFGSAPEGTFDDEDDDEWPDQPPADGEMASDRDQH